MRSVRVALIGTGVCTIGMLLAITSTALAGTAPMIESESASNVTATDAVLEAKIDPGGLETEYQFRVLASPCHASPLNCELASDPLYPSPAGRIAAASGSQPIELDLNSAGLMLQPGQEYHYAVFASNPEGNAGGTDQTFTTLPGTSPSIATESASSITPTDAILEAEIDPGSNAAYYQFQLAKNPTEFASEFTCPTEGFPAGSSLCLGITPQQGALPIRSIPAATTGQSVSLDLESAGAGLEPGATYYYRAIAARIVPTEDTTQWEEPTVFGANMSFTTLPQPAQGPQNGDPGVLPPPLAPSPARVCHHRHRRHHRHHGHRHRRACR
jgi:hypothetical protein